MSHIHIKTFLVLLLLLIPCVFIFSSTQPVHASTNMTVVADSASCHFRCYSPNYEEAWNNASASDIHTTHVSVGQRYGSGFYTISRGALYFDLTSIPDSANITSAILSLYVMFDISTVDVNITVQNGQPTYPHNPAVVGDYFFNYYSGNGGSRNTSTIAGESQFWNITLNEDGRSWLSKTAVTKLLLRSSNDIDNIPTASQEEVEFADSEGAGSECAARLYVAYDFEGCTYVFHGPFYEDGTSPSDTNVTVTLYQVGEAPLVFTLPNGTSTYSVDTGLAPTHCVWNISSPTYNQTRFYNLASATFEDIYIFIPKATDAFYIYTFTVTDLAGVSSAYLETFINVNGTNRVVERQSLETVNAVPFYMVWASKYSIRLKCNRGSYTFGAFTALTEQSQSLIITQAMFPTAPQGMNVTCSALRMNATWIQMNYTDNDALTIWVHVAIQNRSGSTYTTRYSTNSTGATQQVNWYSALSSSDYLATVTAYRSGLGQQVYSFALPKPPSSTNVWDGIFDVLGDWPFPPRNFMGFILVLFMFGAFSYIYMPAGMIIGLIFTSVLTYVRWLDIEWSAISLGFAFAVMFVLAQAKREEREI